MHYDDLSLRLNVIWTGIVTLHIVSLAKLY
jgi:hypothetical protein